MKEKSSCSSRTVPLTRKEDADGEGAAPSSLDRWSSTASME